MSEPTIASRSGSTVAAVLTPSGRGAVAVVAVDGDDALRLVGACFRPSRGSDLASHAAGRIVFGRWGGDDTASEEVVACRRSATCVEVHCHGGAAAVARILGDLADRGAEVVDWRAWRLRDGDDPIAAEADMALAQAATERAARVLLDQRQGALRGAVLTVIEAIAAGRCEQAAAMVAMLLDRWRVGRRLVEPWRIVLAGRPNVGKSSLINRLLGYERAIVFDQPGTTRDVVTATTAFDGWPCELSDTAGLREAGDAIEQAGVERAMAQLARADLVVWVEEVGRGQETGVRRQEGDGGRSETAGGNGDAISDSGLMLGEIVHLLSPGSYLPIPELPYHAVPIIRIRNKCDLPTAEHISRDATLECLATSAKSGEGIAELAAAIVARLVGQPPAAGVAVPFTERQAKMLSAAEKELGRHRPHEAAIRLRELIAAAGR